MSYEQLLHDFVDGSLDYQGEMTLFAELGSNEGLRRELKLLMLMQKAAMHDVKAFTPAPDSHEAIFARLGFSPGLIETPAPYPGYRGMRGGYLQGIIGGVVGAIVMAFILLGLGDRLAGWYARPSSPATAAAAHRTAPTPLDGAWEAGGSPMPHTVIAAPEANLPPSERGRRTAHREIAAPPRRSEAMPERPAPTASETALFDAARTSPSRLPAERPMPPLARLPEGPAPISAGTAPADFIVEYRALAGGSFRRMPEELAIHDDPLLDRAIAAHYRLDGGTMIGIEAGRESFYQRFDEALGNGDTMLHEQNPALFWGGASFTRFLRDGPGIRPYLRGTLGGTRVGPMGRLMVGAAYDVGADIQLLAGADVSALAYMFDGRWFLSPKYGVSYGLSLRF